MIVISDDEMFIEIENEGPTRTIPPAPTVSFADSNEMPTYPASEEEEDLDPVFDRSSMRSEEAAEV